LPVPIRSLLSSQRRLTSRAICCPRGRSGSQARGSRTPHPRSLVSVTESPASSWAGDAKLAGIAVEEPQPDHLRFRLDIREASTVHVDGDKLAIEVWNPGRGVRRITR
jgi:hypothetical protein